MRKCVKAMLIFSNGDYDELSRESGISLDDMHEFINAKYKPVEPLIKDEKAREAVRVRAEANMIDSVMYDKDEDCIIEPVVAEDTVELLKSENAYLMGIIEAYEEFLKSKGYIKEEK